MIVCEICSREFKTHVKLSNHLRKHSITSKNYFDKFFKNSNDGICEQFSIVSTCKKYTKFYSLEKEYNRFCNNRECFQSSDTVKDKRQKTFDDRYNGHPMYVEEIKTRAINSLRKTILARKSEIVEKRKNTCLERYGKDNPEKIREFQKKKIETCLKKYKTKYAFQADVVKEKCKQTMLKNHGVDSPLKSEVIRGKLKQTCLKKYNVDNPFKIPEVKENIKIFMEENMDEINQKREITCLEKYGVKTSLLDFNTQLKIINQKKSIYSIKVKDILEKLNIEALSDYIISGDLIKFKCLKCQSIFETSYFNIRQRGSHPCDICFPLIHGSSELEKEILEFVKSICNGEIIENSRKIIPPKEIDIYIPSKNIAIEFNGLYWHSEEVMGDNAKNYHLNKTNKCKEKGIQLIHIFEDEWLFKKDIVKSRLRNILDISENKIFATECLIKEIESGEKNEFLEHNHIQGEDNSIIKLGSFYKGELISVMTFSKGKSIENIWELNRFCSKLNYQVVGIASKLLSHFKKNYIWKEIFSYADRRWSMGNVYEKLGFESSRITKPNYWYIKGLKRIHRFNLRRRLDESKDIPEWILRQQEGYSKIWDCGNLKFLMINSK